MKKQEALLEEFKHLLMSEGTLSWDMEKAKYLQMHCIVFSIGLCSVVIIQINMHKHLLQLEMR